MADTNDMEVRFGADTSELDGASKQAAQSVQSVSDTMKTATASVTSYSNTLTAAQRYTQQATDGHKQMARAAQDSAQAAQELAGKYGSAGAQAAEFGKGLRALNDELKAGTITQAEHAAQLAALRSSVFGAGQAVDDAAKNVLNFGMSTSHAINGVRALGDELASGRIRQADGTFLRLVTEMASANPVLAAAVVAAVGAGIAFADLAAHAEELARAANGVEVAFAATGRTAEYSVGQVKDFIRQLSDMPNISQEDAEKTVEALSRMPDLSRPIFEQLLGMVDDFATATGQKAPAAAKELAEAINDPVKGAERLDKQLNFLTATERLAIETADEHGDRMKAQQTVIDALKDRIQGLTKDAMTPLQQAEYNVKVAWHDLNVEMEQTNGLANAIQWVANFIGWLKKANDAMKDFRANGMGLVGDADNWVKNHRFGGGGNTPVPVPPKSGGGNSGPNLLTRQVNLGNSAPSDADQQAERNRLANEGLKLAEKYGGKAAERLKLEREINQMLADRKAAEGQPEVQARIDQGIAGAREKLANLNKPKKVSHKGEATEMDQWRAQFEQMKAQSLEKTGQEDYQAEIAFWQRKLQVAKAGSKEYIEVENEISRLRISAAREAHRQGAKDDQAAYNAKIQSLKSEQAEYSNNMAKRIQIEDQILALVKQRYGDDSAQYQKELQKKIQLQREYQLQQAQFVAEDLNRGLKSGDTAIAVENALAQEKLKLHQMTEQQMTQLEMDEETRRYNAKKQTLDIEKQLYKDFPKQYQQILAQIEQMEAQHKIRMQQLQTQLVTQQKKMWTDAGQAAQNAMTSSLQGILRGTTTFQGLMENVALAVADSFIQTGVKMAADWVAQQLGMTAATAAANATSGASSIATQAAVGAASAYASTAAIPVTGPELAPAAAAAAYGNIMAFQGALTVASAAGGWEVPRDQLMQVHEKEVVLPRAWAERFKAVTDNQAVSNAGGGTQGQLTGGGGSPHIHIHTNDSKSFERQLSDSDSHLHTMFKKFLRNNHIK